MRILPIAGALLAVAPLVLSPFLNPGYAAAQQQARKTGMSPLDERAECHYKQLSMAAMLHDLSTRYGISILSDGEPLLQTADLEYGGTLRQTFDRVAGLFDYSVTVSKSGIVTMEKRFTNPEDLPQLNVAEIRQTAIDMLKILPKVAYDPDPHAWAYDIRRLAQGLTPDQWTLLKEGKRLPLADLSPAQQAAVVGIIRLRAYGMPVSVWEMLRRQLDRFDDSVLRAEKRGVFNEVDGRATAYYDIDHESRGVDGVVTKTPIGTFQRSVKP